MLRVPQTQLHPYVTIWNALPSQTLTQTAPTHPPMPQFLMVREVFALARVRQQEKKVPGFRAQQWYFFFVAAFYLYIRQGQGAGRGGVFWQSHSCHHVEPAGGACAAWVTSAPASLLCWPLTLAPPTEVMIALPLRPPAGSSRRT